MNLPTASAVTWSMTATGRKAKPVIASRFCAKCGQMYEPTGPNQRNCAGCMEVKVRKRPYTSSVTLEEAPDDPDEVPGWLQSGKWKTVESAWVSLVVEQFGTDDNRASLARALVAIRERYRGVGAEH